jgi:hypothetical protein
MKKNGEKKKNNVAPFALFVRETRRVFDRIGDSGAFSPR